MRARSKSTQCAPTPQGGITLLETLVAIALFSVGVLGTVTLQGRTIRHIDDAHHRATAVHLASSLIATMRSDNPLTLAARYASDQQGARYRDFVALARVLPGAGLTGNAPEVRVDSGPSLSSYSVTVTLRWQMPGETQPHRYSITSVLARNG